MTPFEQQISVWTHNHDPAWTDYNGVSDMALTNGMPHDQAMFTAQRLLMLRPDLTFELRNIHNEVVEEITAQKKAQEKAKPSRRALRMRSE